MSEQHLEFEHPVLHEAVPAIGGEYQFSEEKRVAAEGGDILYYKGFFMIDRSCCGVGGSAYAMVAGVVARWHCKTAGNGRPVSLVRPVRSTSARTRITAMIKSEDPLCQVTFL